MKPIRVLITDDHMIVREGLRLILETAPEIEVVGEASDGAECLRCVAEAAPDVVLMDLQMPGINDKLHQGSAREGDRRHVGALSAQRQRRAGSRDG